MRDTFDLPALTAELSTDEGRKSTPYTDTRGNMTIGVGRNLTRRGLSPDEIDLLFANDVTECCAEMDGNIPWWRTLPEPQQRVMINLCFNVGWGSLSEFHKFLFAMQARAFVTAAAELKDSRWWGQVGERGPRVVARLLARG